MFQAFSIAMSLLSSAEESVGGPPEPINKLKNKGTNRAIESLIPSTPNAESYNGLSPMSTMRT
jgi:hypothetical protein